MVWLLGAVALAAGLPGIPGDFDEADGAWTLSNGTGKLAGLDGYKLDKVNGQDVTDWDAVRKLVLEAEGPIKLTLSKTVGPEPAATPEPATDGEGTADGEGEAEAEAEAEGEAEAEAPTEGTAEEAKVDVREVEVDKAFVSAKLEETIELPAAGLTWLSTRNHQALLTDGKEALYAINPSSGEVSEGHKGLEPDPYTFPEAFWRGWGGSDWMIADTFTDNAKVAETFGSTFLLGRWKHANHDVVLSVKDASLEVWFIEPPAGITGFPTCESDIPETCLASARTILRDMHGEPGAYEEAIRHYDLACEEGVVRGCFEVIAHGEDTELVERAEACIDGDGVACNVLGTEELESAQTPRDLVIAMHMLEYACDLGEAAACRTAAEHFKKAEDQDHVLRMLDHGCVHGDAEQCEEAGSIRHQAFALGMARACLADPIDGAACFDLGHLLEEEDVDTIKLDAFGAFERSCAGGVEEGCKRLGHYVDRWGMEDKRVQDATSDLLEKCTEGLTHACVGAGHLLVRTNPRKDPYGQAKELYLKACEAGDSAGCVGAAEELWIKKGKRVKGPKTEELWQKACDADYGEGCLGLGHHLHANKKHFKRSVEAWEKGCKLGNASACTQVGKLLVQRKHFKSDVTAEQVFGDACNEGELEGCYQLGLLKSPGHHIKADADAYVLFEKACDGNYMQSCERLGEVHLARKTHYDAEQAAKFFTPACDVGQLNSCRLLADQYKKGNGVKRSRHHARQLYIKAGTIEPRKFVRIGAKLGLPNLLGLDAEVVLPLPGPALTVGTDFTFLPGQTNNIMYIAPTVRLYPSHKARGFFGAVGYHQININVQGEGTQNQGFNARFGLRQQSKRTFASMEFGLGTVSVPEVEEIIAPVPVIIPMGGVTVGWVPF